MTSEVVSRVLADGFGLDPFRLCEWRVTAATEARRRALCLDTTSEYNRLLEANGEEQVRLVQELLVHESSFLRHPRSFEHLGESVRSGQRTPSPSRPLRVLSVGCARGEEPYSAAIALVEAGVEPGALRIEAVDISPAILQQAESGVYPSAAVRTIPSDVRQRWFEPTVSGDWRLTDPIRRLVSFRSANVVDHGEPEIGTHDVVLCRNLLIYLGSAARRRLANLLRRALAPGGTLYAGQSELLPLSHLGFVIEDRSALALRHAPAPNVAAPGAWGP